uniref:Reverse transcriptase domain-containing protein n=1 Tax=Tanacetum cinerariifolium TaxID=118510 RepID=A0A6L2J5L1_TANCI|nr:hypothetical protein [Tanacetum cinerariifolium]
MNDVDDRWNIMIELGNKIIQILGEMKCQREQMANLSTHTTESSRHFNSICYDDDDDDEEKTIPLRDIISQLPSSIVINTSPPILPIEDPEDSLIMGEKDLNTIPEKGLDEVIKSSVEEFFLIPSEFEDTSESDSECDLPSCDDISPIDVLEGKTMTLSNPLFDSNDDFTSSDDESLSDEDVLEDNVKIYSNPLFEFDDEYISSDVNPLFDEVLEDIERKASYDFNHDEPGLLVTPLFDYKKDECFKLEGDVDKINAFDISLDFKDGYYDSEGDVLYLESLLSDDTTPNLHPEVFLDHDPRSLSDINDLKIMVKIFDLEILEKNFSPTYIHIEVFSVLWRNRLPIQTVRGRCLGLYIPSATSVADVAATLVCGTQSTDVPCGLTRDPHADVVATTPTVDNGGPPPLMSLTTTIGRWFSGGSGDGAGTISCNVVLLRL